LTIQPSNVPSIVMKASEKIKNLDPEHMSDLMHADADEHSNVGEGPNLFVAYLDRDYPNLLAFLFQAMEEMPFADDDKAMQFMVGQLLPRLQYVGR